MQINHIEKKEANKENFYEIIKLRKIIKIIKKTFSQIQINNVIQKNRRQLFDKNNQKKKPSFLF